MVTCRAVSTVKPKRRCCEIYIKDMLPTLPDAVSKAATLSLQEYGKPPSALRAFQQVVKRSDLVVLLLHFCWGCTA